MTSRDILHERLQSAFTLANQLCWIAQQTGMSEWNVKHENFHTKGIKGREKERERETERQRESERESRGEERERLSLVELITKNTDCFRQGRSAFVSLLGDKAPDHSHQLDGIFRVVGQRLSCQQPQQSKFYPHGHCWIIPAVQPTLSYCMNKWVRDKYIRKVLILHWWVQPDFYCCLKVCGSAMYTQYIQQQSMPAESYRRQLRSLLV